MTKPPPQCIALLTIVLHIPIAHGDESASWMGSWTNTDANTSSTTRLLITNTNGKLLVRGYGKCSPTDCDWGTTPLHLCKDRTDSLGLVGFAAWNQGFTDRYIVLRLKSSQLVVESFDIFKDNSGRSPSRIQEVFKRSSDPLGPLPVFDPALSPPHVTSAPGATLDPLLPSRPNEPVPAPTFGPMPFPAVNPLDGAPPDPAPYGPPPRPSRPGGDYFRDAARLSELASLKVKDKENAESVLQELRLLRWKALSDRVDALRATWHAGVDKRFEGELVGEYLDALADLLRAELDLCKTAAERVTVCSSLLESARRAETITEAKRIANAEGGTIQASTIAKAARLQAEIELLRERIRGDYWGPATQRPQIEVPASAQPAVRRPTAAPSLPAPAPPLTPPIPVPAASDTRFAPTPDLPNRDTLAPSNRPVSEGRK